MRIGGWWRLSIATSGLYAVVVIVITAFSWPDVANISHHPSFTYRMSEPTQAVLNKAGPKTLSELEQALVAADKQGEVSEAKRLASEILARRKQPWSGDPIVLEMPNGHRFEVAGNTEKHDSELVAQEYVRVLRSELDGRRREILVNAILAWLVPVLAACLLGMVSRWVYAGFIAGKK